ncbi:AMP-dependent synthetase/ligase [Polycladomyces subterraneus]|uniref:Long-chain fatty acid--CoA ligase n=1 Tax=Polycladomyces subterraneus TaxID=1016997 RepID=A0ABT8IKC2_9BACL|nr:long-chain fatty acid--CoA ligase [Polycladomyces subterraneus]MDN4593188.1 long-chain fatty acid--CoA ligase [Polycladomyces subterraneus]
MKPKNLLDMVRRTVNSYPDKPALMYKSNGVYRGITYRQLWEQVRDTAAGLVRFGLRSGDKVALISENHPFWPVTDLAVASLGGVSVPVYPTLPPDQVAFILKNADCRMAVVEDEHQLEKVREGGVELTNIVVMKPGPSFTGEKGILSFDALLKEGAAHPLENWEEEWKKIDRDHLVTIIHTSGTTGRPKGVMLTHGNFLANMEGIHFWCLEVLPDDVFLSYLPLSHVFERLAGQFVPLSVGATIAYAESTDTIQENLLEVKPTVMTSVPRLFEKVYARVQEQVDAGTPLRRKIFDWAVRVGMERYEYYLRTPIDELLLGGGLPPKLKLRWKIADRLVYRKVKERLGGRIRGMVSGGAPLNPEIAQFFWAINLPVLEGYGMTETAPVIATNPMVRTKIGTVGKPLPNVEIRIADDGEVLVRGPNVMQGYYKNPEATKEQIRDGWLHTGDLGELDEDGYLKIIDRKKNLIILSTGKNLAPQPIENAINNSPYIAQSVLIGHGRKYVIALVVPDFENLEPWAQKQGWSTEPRESLVRRTEVQQLLQREVQRLTAGFAAYEQPKKVLVAEKEWTIEGGELTPTLKVRVKEIEKRYRELIERAYAEETPSKTERPKVGV